MKDDLLDLPNGTVSRVYTVIQGNEDITAEEIEEISGKSRKEVQRAISALKKRDLISESAVVYNAKE